MEDFRILLLHYGYYHLWVKLSGPWEGSHGSIYDKFPGIFHKKY